MWKYGSSDFVTFSSFLLLFSSSPALFPPIHSPPSQLLLIPFSTFPFLSPFHCTLPNLPFPLFTSLFPPHFFLSSLLPSPYFFFLLHISSFPSFPFLTSPHLPSPLHFSDCKIDMTISGIKNQVRNMSDRVPFISP